MSERLRTLQRIKALQKTLAELAEWKFLEAERAKLQAEAARVGLETFIAVEHPSGSFASLAGRTLTRLSQRETEAGRHSLALAGSKRQAETRLKLSERFVEACEGEERDSEERRRLEELTEAMLAAAQTGVLRD